MTAQEVLEKAIERGVFLYVHDQQLKYRARAGALSLELKNELKANRALIVQPWFGLVGTRSETSIGADGNPSSGADDRPRWPVPTRD